MQTGRVFFDLFPYADDELLVCAELFRTWLIETNQWGPKHEAHLREADVGQLVKWMASHLIESGGYFSRERLSDRIAEVHRQKQAPGSNAA